MTTPSHRAIASHVINADKPITSRTGASRAAKARQTLATAEAILSGNGQTGAAMSCREVIRRINEQLKVYYEAERDRMAAAR
ncbi:hypothetical protein SEA_ZENTENO07_4 [Mycobacterium phage Zenteno07]|nr:hypothetical protein SEA_ZENTENO07_4 [Mycobacterium phage Zenteno07]